MVRFVPAFWAGSMGNRFMEFTETDRDCALVRNKTVKYAFSFAIVATSSAIDLSGPDFEGRVRQLVVWNQYSPAITTENRQRTGNSGVRRPTTKIKESLRNVSSWLYESV